MSKASTTEAKIVAQGGIHSAVSTDTAESTIKASMQQGSIAEQSKILAGGGEAGEELSKAIKEGSATGASMLAAGIASAASTLGAAQGGAKTLGDINQVIETGGKDAFIEASGVEGLKRGAISKVQNIDAGKIEVSSEQVAGILSTPKTEDRQEILESLKRFEMVEENSTLDNFQSTSGAKYLKGKAAAAAATMSQDNRLFFGGYSFHLSTDSSTGQTRVEATNAQGLTTGKYVHDRTGIRVDNPVQMITKATTELDPTDMYTGQDANGDGNADGGGVGYAAVYLSALGVLGGAVMHADKFSGKRISGAARSIGHRVIGHLEGQDSSGKGGVYYSQENWEKLEKNGMAQKGEDGKWELTEDRAKAKSFIGSQPSSRGSFQKSTTSQSTIPDTPPNNAAVNMNTPLDKNIPNYTTKNEISKAKKDIESIKPNDGGNAVLQERLEDAKSRFPEGSPERTRITQMINASNSGRPLDAAEVEKITGESVPVGKDGKVNTYKMGIDAKNGALDALDVQELQVKHPSVPDVDVSESPRATKAKSKVGKVLAAVGGFFVTGAVLPESADAKPVNQFNGKHNLVEPEDGSGTAPLSSADQIGFATQGAFNVLNAAGAAIEMKGGASRNIADLAKGSSYLKGVTSTAVDAVDFSDFKGVASSFGEEGIVAGAKIGGKALGKSALKKLPVIGLGAGMAFAADRASEGDYIGAAMEFASGALSLIPGIGTAASVAIDGALMKRDYDKATMAEDSSAANKSTFSPVENRGANELLTPQEQNSLTPSQKLQTVNNRIQSMSDEEAGASYLSSVTPEAQRDTVLTQAKNGSLTKQAMREHGVPLDVIDL